MTHQRLRQPLRLAGAVLTAATLLLTTPAWAGTAERSLEGASPSPSRPAEAGAAGPARETPAPHIPMMDMSGQWKQMDARLDSLIEQMNGATGTAKVDAMAAVITELVLQREQMHRMYEEMYPGAHHRGMTQPARGEMMQRGMGTTPSESPAASAKMCVRPTRQFAASSANGSSS